MDHAVADGGAEGYMVHVGGGKPGVVVLQEWWGLVPHVKDVTERFAQVHERLRKQNTKGLPAMDRISAFKRVLGADATPEKSVEIMHAAKARVDEMRSMLRN